MHVMIVTLCGHGRKFDSVSSDWPTDARLMPNDLTQCDIGRHLLAIIPDGPDVEYR